MPAPSSFDLRQRILSCYEKGQGTISQLAERFQVSQFFISQLLKRYREEKTLSPRPHPSGNRSPIQEIHRPFFEAELKENPDLTLVELCQKFGEHFGVTPSESAMSRALKRLKISRKKNTL